MAGEDGRELEELTALERNGQIAEATMLLDKLLRADPDDRLLRYRKAILAICHDLPAEGVKAAADFSTRFVADRNGPLLLAAANLQADRPAKALSYLDDLEEREGASSRSRKLRADALLALGRPEEARALIALLPDADGEPSAPDEGPEPPLPAAEAGPWIAYYVARWLTRRGELDAAMDEYANGLAAFPGDVRLTIESALVDWRRGNVADAMPILEDAFRRHPGDPRVANCVIQGLRARGKHLAAFRAAYAARSWRKV